jgi:hypothetical protein
MPGDNSGTCDLDNLSINELFKAFDSYSVQLCENPYTEFEPILYLNLYCI